MRSGSDIKNNWAALTSEEKLDHLKEENDRLFGYISALSETVKDLRRQLESGAGLRSEAAREER